MKVKPNTCKTNDKTTLRPKLRFSEQIASKAKRKLKAQKHSATSAWFGLGMMGLIGWSIALPTILGAALGTWLDKHYKIQHSPTRLQAKASITEPM